MAEKIRFGISSSCLYPMATEEAISLLGEMGVKEMELFPNDPSELVPPLSEEILGRLKKYDITLSAVHSPFSALDAFFLFTDYPRRLETGLKMYDTLFAFAAKAKAKFVVFHGDRAEKKTTPKEYAAVLNKLHRRAKEFGLLFLQENVSYTKCGSPAFLKEMLAYADKDLLLTFDAKQARRASCQPSDFLPFADRIVHAHLSAENEKSDCLLPDNTTFPLLEVYDLLNAAEQLKSVVLELYKEGYSSPADLPVGCEKLRQEFENLTKKGCLKWNEN